ncbi:MAG: PAT family beta-lactamase induction signal transducer AmpG [Gammaproteobacteria bacterium]|jgi:PAT family beta-lactamase induction signal transducer AmpG
MSWVVALALFAGLVLLLVLIRDQRQIIIFCLGIASGYPWVLIGSAMSAWLVDAGLSRGAVGYFGSIFAVYAFNFLWAPLLDRFALPVVSALGKRRSWILVCQVILLFLTAAVAFTDPAVSLFWTSLVAVSIAVVSATQDIAVDAYRIEHIPRDDEAGLSRGAAMATAGWWTGYALIGALPFLLVDLPSFTWQNIYLLLAALWVPMILVVLWAKEPAESVDRVIEKANSVGEWLSQTLVAPLKEFFQRNGVQLAISLLLFIFLFKIGEAFLGRMSIVFYKEVGFSNASIGEYSKIVGWATTIIFSIVGSQINRIYGVFRGLLIGGIAMAASNLMFAYIAAVGPEENLLAIAVMVDGFTGAIATVAFVSFISFLTSHNYSATQYALMASLGNLGRTTLAATSGSLVTWLDGNWSLFFIITALMVVPSLVLLVVVFKKVKGHETL